MDATRMLAIAGFSDPVSSISHLGGAVVFAFLAASLVRRGGGDTAGRAVLKQLDHAAIFVLIAGSFTPVHVILFRGVWRWGTLAAIWCAAIAGVVVKTVYFDVLPEWLGLTMYLGLGWIGVFSAAALARRHGWRFIRPVLWGALAYTVGALAEFLRWPQLLSGILGPHEIFHLAVLAGISFHWKFILGCASAAGAASAVSGAA
jgi:channel protein (hemolysin III family)